MTSTTKDKTLQQEHFLIRGSIEEILRFVIASGWNIVLLRNETLDLDKFALTSPRKR